MRADMKDVIIDTGRRGKGYDSLEKTQRSDQSIDELDSLPERQGMKKRVRGWGAEFGDRINPLRRWLHKNVGRPWDKVFSEFCEFADSRNIRGRHLHEHLWMEVDTWNEREALLGSRWRRASGFYIDKKGFLRGTLEWRKSQREPNRDPDKCQIGERRFERINNCWFEAWYVQEERPHKRWDFMKQANVVEYFLVDVVDRKRQLSKKALRKLGLSNDPDFKWWK